MLINSIRAEWTKLTSTKSFYWTSALIVVLSCGFSIIMGLAMKSAMESSKPEDLQDGGALLFSPVTAVQGFSGFGTMVIIIMATLFVTTEYRFKTMNASIMVTPKRPIIVVSKAVVYGVVAAVLAFITSVGCVVSFKAFAGEHGKEVAVFSHEANRTHMAAIVQTLLVVIFAIGVAFLVRQTAGAIAIMLLWTTVIEGLLMVIPKVGTRVKGYLPFANLDAWVRDTRASGAPWDETGSLLYFAAWALVLFVAGVVVFTKRDA